MNKKKLNATETKKEFVNSIYKWLMNTLKQNGKEEYQSCFTIGDSSILCEIPSEYFDLYEIPKETKIEMKFTTKRS